MSRTSRITDALDVLLTSQDVTDLERLQMLHQVHQLIAAELLPQAVERCLDHGETWQAVADTLGLRSRQAAQQQWGRRLTMRRLA